MTMVIRNDGLAASGDELLTLAPFALVTGAAEIRYVDSATGTNAASGGQNPLEPLANVFDDGSLGNNCAYAEITTAKSAIIVVAAGHTESITNTAALSKTSVTIIGMGSGTSRPKFTLSKAAADTLQVTGARTRFYNCWFVGGTNATGAANARISATVAGVKFVRCRFDCGANDDGEMLEYSNAASDNCTVEDCDFVVTADGGTRGLLISGACDAPLVTGCTFDGGSWGWDTEAFTMNAAVVGYQIHDLTLKNSSFMSISDSAATGYIAGIDCDATSGWNVAVP